MGGPSDSITDAAFENLRVIYSLNMACCTQLSITRKVFECVGGIRVLFVQDSLLSSATDLDLEVIFGLRCITIFGDYNKTK